MPAMTPSTRRLGAAAIGLATAASVALGSAPAHAATLQAGGGALFFISYHDNGNGTVTKTLKNTSQVTFRYTVFESDTPMLGGRLVEPKGVLGPGQTKSSVKHLAPGRYYVIWLVEKSGFRTQNNGQPFTMGAAKAKPKKEAPKKDGPKKLGPNTKVPQGQCTYCNPKPGNPPKAPVKPAPKGPFGIDFGSLKL